MIARGASVCIVPRAAARSGALAARLAGLGLGTAGTALAAVACADPLAYGATGIGAAMLLYAGSAAAFFRADNYTPGRGAARRRL